MTDKRMTPGWYILPGAILGAWLWWRIILCVAGLVGLAMGLNMEGVE